MADWRPSPAGPKKPRDASWRRAAFLRSEPAGLETEAMSMDGQVPGEAWMPEARPRRDRKGAQNDTVGLTGDVQCYTASFPTPRPSAFLISSVSTS